MEGSLDVSSGSVRVKRDDGFYVRFYPGSYRTRFTDQGDRIYFTIDRKGVSTGVTVIVPRGQQIPDNGQIQIDSTRTGQGFDIVGSAATKTEDSALVRTDESCIYYRREWVCDHRPHGNYCRWEDVPYQGWRDVEYFDRVRTKDVLLTLDSPGIGSGSFAGRDITRERIYTYVGRCY